MRLLTVGLIGQGLEEAQGRAAGDQHRGSQIEGHPRASRPPGEPPANPRRDHDEEIEERRLEINT